MGIPVKAEEAGSSDWSLFSNKTDALKAYGELLRKNYNDESNYFAVVDLDTDGVPELLLTKESRFTDNQAYSYQNGKAVLLQWKDAPSMRDQVKSIPSKGIFSFFAGGWIDNDTYMRGYLEYQLRDGKIRLINDVSRKEHYKGSAKVSYCDNYLLNGKSCTKAKFQEIEKQFKKGKEIIYKKCTEKNWESEGLTGNTTSSNAVSSTKIPSAKKSSTKKIKAAKLSGKNKKARKAYQAFLAKNKFKRTKENKFKYALIDLDSNGIDELLIDSGGTGAYEYYLLYTFTNGKVKKLLFVDRAPFTIYNDGTLEYDMGHMGTIKRSFYKIKKGKANILLQMYGALTYPSIPKAEKKHVEEGTDGYWYFKKIGKKRVSYADCEKWIKKFYASHKKIKIKYHKNTAKNRKSMLKK